MKRNSVFILLSSFITLSMITAEYFLSEKSDINPTSLGFLSVIIITAALLSRAKPYSQLSRSSSEG